MICQGKVKTSGWYFTDNATDNATDMDDIQTDIG